MQHLVAMSCSHHSHIPPVRGFAASTPHGEAAGQDALYGAPVECSEDGRGQEGSAHPSQEVQKLLCLLDQCCSVHRPGEVVCDVHPQQLGTADHLHSHVVDEKWSMAGLLLPEVNNDLFGFVHIQDQVIFDTPGHQLLHLLPVSQVMVISDEAHHCCFVHKLHNVFGSSSWDAVVSHQREQQGAQDTALRGPVRRVMTLEVF